MSVELLFTSAPKGLKQGSRGFCTVLSTAGMPVNLANRLEALSAYRHVFKSTDKDSKKNPINHCHMLVSVGGRTLSVLSQIRDFGVDYSQRTNKLAHHVVPDANEQVAAGPAWLIRRGGLMRGDWNGQCLTPPTGPHIQAANQSPAICRLWQEVTGDAGWGAVVAAGLLPQSKKTTWIIFNLDQAEQLLSLIDEAIALLPPEKRWQATFSTYATNVPPDVQCKVRCVLQGTDDARLAPARGAVVDLTEKLPPAPNTPFSEVAREGPRVASSVLSVSVTSATGPGAAVDEPICEPVVEIAKPPIEADVPLDEYRVRPPSPPDVGKRRTTTSTRIAVRQNSKVGGLSNREWFLVAGIATLATLFLIVLASIMFPHVVSPNNSVAQAGDVPGNAKPAPSEIAESDQTETGTVLLDDPKDRTEQSSKEQTPTEQSRNVPENENPPPEQNTRQQSSPAKASDVGPPPPIDAQDQSAENPNDREHHGASENEASSPSEPDLQDSARETTSVADGSAQNRDVNVALVQATLPFEAEITLASLFDSSDKVRAQFVIPLSRDLFGERYMTQTTSDGIPNSQPRQFQPGKSLAGLTPKISRIKCSEGKITELYATVILNDWQEQKNRLAEDAKKLVKLIIDFNSKTNQPFPGRPPLYMVAYPTKAIGNETTVHDMERSLNSIRERNSANTKTINKIRDNFKVLEEESKNTRKLIHELSPSPKKNAKQLQEQRTWLLRLNDLLAPANTSRFSDAEAAVQEIDALATAIGDSLKFFGEGAKFDWTGYVYLAERQDGAFRATVPIPLHFHARLSTQRGKPRQ